MVPQVHDYATRLNEIRKQVREAIQGLDPAGLNWTPLPKDTSSLAVLVNHMVGIERFWTRQVIGGVDIQRRRDAEFVAKAASRAELEALLDQGAHDAQGTLAGLAAHQLMEERTVRGETRTVQSCLLVALEHLATHLGHVQLTRQLVVARGPGKGS